MRKKVQSAQSKVQRTEGSALSPFAFPLSPPPLWDTLPLTDEEAPGRYPQEQGTRYLLPCVRLYYGGIYEYFITDVPTARRWVLDGPMQSYLSHPFVAKAFERIIGFFCTPPAQKGPLPALTYTDEALVFSIDGYETLPDFRRGDSKAIDQLVEKEHFTLALLKRLS